MNETHAAPERRIPPASARINQRRGGLEDAAAEVAKCGARSLGGELEECDSHDLTLSRAAGGVNAAVPRVPGQEAAYRRTVQR